LKCKLARKNEQGRLEWIYLERVFTQTKPVFLVRSFGLTSKRDRSLNLGSKRLNGFKGVLSETCFHGHIMLVYWCCVRPLAPELHFARCRAVTWPYLETRNQKCKRFVEIFALCPSYALFLDHHVLRISLFPRDTFFVIFNACFPTECAGLCRCNFKFCSNLEQFESSLALFGVSSSSSTSTSNVQQSSPPGIDIPQVGDITSGSGCTNSLVFFECCRSGCKTLQHGRLPKKGCRIHQKPQKEGCTSLRGDASLLGVLLSKQ